MFPHKILVLASLLAMAGRAYAQTSQPQVKVNVLHVCSPSAEDQKELSSALAKVPGKPVFSKDFEVSRGHSTLDPNTPIPGMQQLPAGTTSSANFVRVRREFPDGTMFSNVQYSFSVDEQNMVETLVLRVRDPKDVMQIAIEDSASAVASAAAMLASATPVSRVRLERFGKSPIALARCAGNDENPATDQTVYEPIFHAASAIMQNYRSALGARKTVPGELTRLGVGTSVTPAKASSRAATKPATDSKKSP